MYVCAARSALKGPKTPGSKVPAPPLLPRTRVCRSPCLTLEPLGCMCRHTCRLFTSLHTRAHKPTPWGCRPCLDLYVYICMPICGHTSSGTCGALGCGAAARVCSLLLFFLLLFLPLLPVPVHQGQRLRLCAGIRIPNDPNNSNNPTGRP